MYVKQAIEIYAETFCLGFGQRQSARRTRDQAVGDLAENQANGGLFAYLWISDPALLDGEARDQEFVYALKPTILKQNGRQHNESRNDLKGTSSSVSGEAAKKKMSFDLGGPKLAWHAILGTSLPSAVVLVGKGWKADKEAPPGTSLYRVGDKLFVGATLARVNRDSRVATFEPETLDDMTATMAKQLGKTAQLRVLYDAELVSSTEEQAPSKVASPPADDGSTDTESVLTTLRDLAADVFDVPFIFEKCTSDGRAVRVHFQLNERAGSVVVAWTGPLGGAGDVDPVLIQMLSDDLAEYAEE